MLLDAGSLLLHFVYGIATLTAVNFRISAQLIERNALGPLTTSMLTVLGSLYGVISLLTDAFSSHNWNANHFMIFSEIV